MDNLEAIGAIIGLVNGIRLLQEGNRWGFVYFCSAIAAGVLFGYFNWFGLPSVQLGLLAALASSGLYRVGQVAGESAGKMAKR